MLPLAEQPAESELTTTAARARLVRLCARLTGDWHAAEDLAQETLLAAWRNEHTLRDPQARPQWLAGIARNMCLRWARTRGRELARLSRPGAGDDSDAADGVEGVADDFDVEVALERDELARLLDRALALLPPETREVLVARYIADSPYAEIAARLGVSEKAVSMRLARGKLLLRRILMTDLRQDAAPYGLGGPTDGASWQETRIWCPNCGARRLIGCFDRAIPALTLRCPGCYADGGVEVVAQTAWAEALAGAHGYKAAFSRLARMATAEYRYALEHGEARCNRCGHPAQLRMGMPVGLPPAARDLPGAHIVCASCSYVTNQSLRGLVLASPEGRDFWREHPRIRILPERPIAEVAGRASIVTSFESVTGKGRLHVVSARDDFRVLAIHATPTA